LSSVEEQNLDMKADSVCFSRVVLFSGLTGPEAEGLVDVWKYDLSKCHNHI